MFNETSNSFCLAVSCLALLLPLLSGSYRVHSLRVSSLCLVARRQFLPLPSFREVVCFCLLSSSLPSCVFSLSFSSSIFDLLALSYPLVSLPDLGCHFAFLFSSAFVYIPMLCHRSSEQRFALSSRLPCGHPYNIYIQTTTREQVKRESERARERERGGTKEDVIILSFPMSEA